MLHLFKLLYQRRYAKGDIIELMRFIDWIMVLPQDLETQFDEAVFQYEEEQHMQYITSFERYGFKKGRQEGRQEGHLETSRENIVDVLQIRFQQVPKSVVLALNELKDLTELKQLHRSAVTVKSLDEFLALLERHAVAA